MPIKMYHHLPSVNFVKEKEYIEEDKDDNTCINGEEIRLFYEKVICEENSEKKMELKMDKKDILIGHEGKKKNSKVIRTKESDIFKFCQHGEYEECAQWLANGFDINLRDSFGWTPLMSASCAGHDLIVKLLLDNKADTQVREKCGNRAMELAMKNRHYNVVQIIIDYCKKKNKGRNSGEHSEDKSVKEDESSLSYCCICDVHYSLSHSQPNHECSIIHQIKTCQTRSRTHYSIPDHNKGFQMMVKEGWNRDMGLGLDGSGRKYPVKTILKRERAGLGVKTRSSGKPKVTHFEAFDEKAVKHKVKHNAKTDPKKRAYLTSQERVKQKQRRMEVELRRSLWESNE